MKRGRRYALVALAALSSGTAQAQEADAITVYPAFSTDDVTAIEGRVIALEETRAPAQTTDRRRDNLRRNLDLLRNKERKGREVNIVVADRQAQGITDDEGYFHVEIAGLSALATGWHRVTAKTVGGESEGAVLVLPPDNTHGIISDLDDTVLITEVNSSRRMLANTFFGNPLTRQAVPGAARAYHALADRNPHPDSAPVFYLSASPRQLHAPIGMFLEHNGFPRGVLITKRVTNDSTSEPLLDQQAYKTARLEEILRRVPNVRFTLFGDDGERDPEIYEELRKRHPERIEAIWIRRVHPDPKRVRFAGQGDTAELLTKTGSDGRD